MPFFSWLATWEVSAFLMTLSVFFCCHSNDFSGSDQWSGTKMQNECFRVIRWIRKERHKKIFKLFAFIWKYLFGSNNLSPFSLCMYTSYCTQELSFSSTLVGSEAGSLKKFWGVAISSNGARTRLSIAARPRLSSNLKLRFNSIFQEPTSYEPAWQTSKMYLQNVLVTCSSQCAAEINMYVCSLVRFSNNNIFFYFLQSL
jgi:hypothetical protein